jgi:hypothetical protein
MKVRFSQTEWLVTVVFRDEDPPGNADPLGNAPALHQSGATEKLGLGFRWARRSLVDFCGPKPSSKMGAIQQQAGA